MKHLSPDTAALSKVLSITATVLFLGMGCAHSDTSTVEEQDKGATSSADNAPSSPAPVSAHPSDHAESTSGSHTHHGGHHRFANADHWAKRFESPTRDAWQQPDAVFDFIGIDDGMLVADIGSATGYFPVRLARRLPASQIWGIDIEPDMVRYLNERASREGLSNLTSLLGTTTDPQLPQPVDMVLMVNTYHHIQERPAYFRTVHDHIKPGGRIAIIDFKMGDLDMGPPDAMKIAPQQIVREMMTLGFVLDKTSYGLLVHQFILVFRRP